MRAARDRSARNGTIRPFLLMKVPWERRGTGHLYGPLAVARRAIQVHNLFR